MSEKWGDHFLRIVFNSKMRPNKCHLDLQTECGGPVHKAKLFEPLGYEISVCKKHRSEHEDIIFLVRCGYDIDEVLQMDSDKREKLAKNCKYQ